MMMGRTLCCGRGQENERDEWKSRVEERRDKIEDGDWTNVAFIGVMLVTRVCRKREAHVLRQVAKIGKR